LIITTFEINVNWACADYSIEEFSPSAVFINSKMINTSYVGGQPFVFEGNYVHTRAEKTMELKYPERPYSYICGNREIWIQECGGKNREPIKDKG
jgi:hypothetical protein